jgi:hypothetical protein
MAAESGGGFGTRSDKFGRVLAPSGTIHEAV